MKNKGGKANSASTTSAKQVNIKANFAYADGTHGDDEDDHDACDY